MKYQKIKKYKYRLFETFAIQTPIKNKAFEHKFFKLDDDGLLTIYAGYLWDGVSGPTWDTLTTMIAGLIHDAFYQAIRLQLITLKIKDIADLFFHTTMLKEGAWSSRAWYFYKAVDKFGSSSCVPGDIKIPKVIEV